MTNCTMGLFELFFSPSMVRSSGLNMYRGGGGGGGGGGRGRKPNCPPPPK